MKTNVDSCCRPKSRSGIPLSGNKIVRTIYLDESGTSANNPIALVCGVIIDADRQWLKVETHLNALIAEYEPENGRFHATELFHGKCGRNRDEKARAHATLIKILSIPSLFGIPLAFGYHKKQPNEEVERARGQFAVHHAMAYSLSAIACERYMRELALPEEIATMVAENTNESKKLVKFMHSILRGAPHTEILFQALPEEYHRLLPLQRIKDTVHFAEKNEAIFLQLADAFGFVMRSFIEGRTNADEFHKELMSSPEQVAPMVHNKELSGGMLVLTPKANPYLTPGRTWSTIPGYEEIRY